MWSVNRQDFQHKYSVIFLDKTRWQHQRIVFKIFYGKRKLEIHFPWIKWSKANLFQTLWKLQNPDFCSIECIWACYFDTKRDLELIELVWNKGDPSLVQWHDCTVLHRDEVLFIDDEFKYEQLRKTLSSLFHEQLVLPKL